MPPKSGQKSLISFFGNGKSSKTEKDIPKKKVQGALKKAFAREVSFELLLFLLFVMLFLR
jgi:hypothetical protein